MAADVGTDPTWRKEEDEANSNFRAFSHPLLDSRIYIFLVGFFSLILEKDYGEGSFLSVFNKSLTYIYNIYTLHRGIIVWENMVHPSCLTTKLYCRSGGSYKIYKNYLPTTKVLQNKRDKHSEMITLMKY